MVSVLLELASLCEVLSPVLTTSFFLAKLTIRDHPKVHPQRSSSAFNLSVSPNVHHQRLLSAFTLRFQPKRSPQALSVYMYRSPPPFTLTLDSQRSPSAISLSVHPQKSPSPFTRSSNTPAHPFPLAQAQITSISGINIEAQVAIGSHLLKSQKVRSVKLW